MRIKASLPLLGAVLVAALTGCTVKDVDAPSLAGPSTLAHSISMVADRHTLTQNGVDFTDIRLSAIGPSGQSENIALRAQVIVAGVPQDYGTLSTKNPITPATIRYTAPAASTLAAGQVAQTVTIRVTPTQSGDFRAETPRELDIRLEPQGVIVPTNPALKPNFEFTPAAPEVLMNVSFDASTTTNNDSPCNNACSYAWNFGSLSTAFGITVAHQFRTATVHVVTLTVTDVRGAQAVVTKAVTVAPGTPPEVDFTFSPTPAVVEQTIFFNASMSRAAPGRSIVSYEWDFGKGTTGTGVTVSKSYDTPGTYTVTLKATDDAGAVRTISKTVQVNAAASGAPPEPDFTFSPTPAVVEQTIFFNASLSRPAAGRMIVSYEWDFGEGTTGTGATINKTYNTPGTYTVTLRTTDDTGASRTISKPVPVNAAQIVPNFTVLPAGPVVNEIVVVNASSTTSTSPIVSYVWSFGVNSTPSTGAGITASTQYSQPGSKVITLTVTDSQGRTASATKVVTVSP